MEEVFGYIVGPIRVQKTRQNLGMGGPPPCQSLSRFLDPNTKCLMGSTFRLASEFYRDKLKPSLTLPKGAKKIECYLSFFVKFQSYKKSAVSGDRTRVDRAIHNSQHNAVSTTPQTATVKKWQIHGIMLTACSPHAAGSPKPTAKRKARNPLLLWLAIW